jgi:hypothetical protein
VIAGYLWLIFIWLAIRPDLSRRTQTTEALFDERASQRLEFLDTLQSGPGTEQLVSSIESALDDIESHTNGFGKHDREIRSQLYAELQEQAHSAGAEMERELSLPATLLVGDRPELFAEVDRLRSEGDLRLTVLPPITAILLLFTIQASPIWLVACGPLFILFAQGVRRQEDARRIIADAIRIGSVQSSAATRFGEWMKYIPERVKELEVRIAQREHEKELDTMWFLREITESGRKASDTVVKTLSK